MLYENRNFLNNSAACFAVNKDMKNAKIIAFACLILFIAALNLFAQDDEQSGMVKTKDGFLVVWNEPGNNFTIEIKGSEVRPASNEQGLLFFVDNKFLQIKTVAKKEFLKETADKNLDDKAVLTAHRDWETDYLNGVFQETLKVNSSWQKLPNGKEALLWNFDMPAKLQSDAKKQIYLVITKGDFILLLNSVVTDTVNEETVKKFLLDTITTLKPSDKPISLKAIQEQILKDN